MSTLKIEYKEIKESIIDGVYTDYSVEYVPKVHEKIFIRGRVYIVEEIMYDVIDNAVSVLMGRNNV